MPKLLVNLIASPQHKFTVHVSACACRKFCTALKDQFPRYHFTVEVLDEICGHYGVGYKNPRGYKESVACTCLSTSNQLAHSDCLLTPVLHAHAMRWTYREGLLRGRR